MKKKFIYRKLKKGELSLVPDMITKYEEQYPYDLEIYTMKGIYYFMLGQYDNAEKVLLDGIKINKLNFDLLYNLSIVYETKKDPLGYIEYTGKALSMTNFDETKSFARQSFSEDENLTAELKNKVDNFDGYLVKLIGIYEKENNLEALKKLKQTISYIDIYVCELENKLWGYEPITFWAWRPLYFAKELNYDKNFYVSKYNMNSYKFENSYDYTTVSVHKIAAKDCPDEKFSIKEKSIVPILLKESKDLKLAYKGKDYTFYQNEDSFYYYTFDDDIKIKNENYVIAEPIILKQDSNKKKLVVQIFIDGLSQTTLEKYGFENLMPKTYSFFNNSIYFTNNYSCAEWTFPSMASYYTGQHITNHNMTTRHVQNTLPTNTKTLGEIFKESGYTTFKIDGDWMTNPDLGYVRGFDKIIYGKYPTAMDMFKTINLTIDSIDCYKDTNQFYCLTFDELHYISDYFNLPESVQKTISLENMQSSKGRSTTSVLNYTDKHKEARYIQQIKYVDKNLGILYNHIKENYSDDEIVISLFSDHGQGFLLKEDAFFFDDERSKVPMIIKGASNVRTYCDEYTSAVDYINIMDKVCNLNADLSNKDGSLPMILGGIKKDYVLTQSLHPARYYRAAIRNDEDYFGFDAYAYQARNDCRVNIDLYETFLKDKDGNIIYDKDKTEKYTNIIFDHMKHHRIYDN